MKILDKIVEYFYEKKIKTMNFAEVKEISKDYWHAAVYTKLPFMKRYCVWSTYGKTVEEANDKMFERNYFGMMMVETGEADAFITGLYTKYSNTIKVAKEVIGIRPDYKHFGTMHILNSKNL